MILIWIVRDKPNRWLVSVRGRKSRVIKQENPISESKYHDALIQELQRAYWL